MVKGVFLAALIATTTIGTAFAQETCESRAVGKDGKALAGAAKTSFMKKCMGEFSAKARRWVKMASLLPALQRIASW